MTANPCQTNTDLLYNNYFQLKILRGTTVLELMVTKANLPGITIPDQAQPTIFGTTIPVPTMSVQYEPLYVEFLVDSNLTNWKSIYSWMQNMTNIQDSTSNNLPYGDWHYTATLILPSTTYKYNGCVDPVLTVGFQNFIPVKLTGIIFNSESNDSQQIKSACTFKYSYYTLNPPAPENLYNSN